MSDEKIIKPDKQPLHPFSKMNRGATRQEAVNAAVNAAQGVYTQLAEEHDRIMGEVVRRFEDNEEEFRIFREVMSRQVRELKRYSFSYVVVSALHYDWLRFKLWVIELFQPAKPTLTPAMASGIEEQRAGVVGGIHPEDIDLAKLGPPQEIVTIESDGTIHSDPIIAPPKAEG